MPVHFILCSIHLYLKHYNKILLFCAYTSSGSYFISLLSVQRTKGRYASLTIAVASLVSLSDFGFLWRRSMSRRESNSPLGWRNKFNMKQGWNSVPYYSHHHVSWLRTWYMCCCTWALHHCLFQYISSLGLSRGQHRVLSSFGPDGFSGSLPELKLG